MRQDAKHPYDGKGPPCQIWLPFRRGPGAIAEQQHRNCGEQTV